MDNKRQGITFKRQKQIKSNAMTVTEEELQRIVARAVKLALGEIKGIDEQTKDEPKPENTESTTGTAFTELSPDELDEAMRLMQSNRGKDQEPQVGSWIEQYPQAVSLIVEEFNLGGTTYEVKTAHHWDIGQKWN